ncbi:hypothetical protein [Pontixanthobacter aquaemixtae]|uniref:Uncharacterized protein n=1 Tax=Pontixanthobacter aquaemixtae TaxID=1958940 RepID=A0A844ZWZ1_9SPHN|nr:hypothetical protein [Pontixanthobacter aquaemixtae]MXO91466.1 hypothetical protein [Pontixanthobacter aquaemixtae]
MSVHFGELADKVAADGHVSAEEILALRQQGWGDGKIYQDEAEAIFAINHQIKDPSIEWVDFFVEAISDMVRNGTEPRGYVSEDEAAWLIAALDQDGKLETMAELELLTHVLERAQNVAETLKHYALKQVEAAVLTGTGPTRCGGTLSDTHISSAECNLVRRIIFSSGGHGPAAVSRFDAEMLFRLKDATLGHDNAPEWQNLFVDGVANYLRGFTAANAQLDHARMKELETFVADSSVNVGRFFGRMAKAAPEVHNHFGKAFGRKPANSGFVAREAAGQIVTENEKNWLDGMVEADGEVDVLERALLDRLAEDAA